MVLQKPKKLSECKHHRNVSRVGKVSLLVHLTVYRCRLESKIWGIKCLFLLHSNLIKTSLFTVTIDGKVWTRAKEVIHGALGYEKSTKTAYEVRAHCSLENYAHKYQLISV